MRKLTQLWRGLERVPGLVAIPAFWEQYCGSDVSLIRPHLRPTGDLGTTFPCPHPWDGDCPRKVVDYADGCFTAVCRHRHKLCSDVALTKREALLHELDLAPFLKPITQALGLRWQDPVLRFPGVWALGLSARIDTRNQPAFLQVQGRQLTFLEGVRRLFIEIDGPFLLIAPTERFRDIPVQELIQARGIGFISLEEHVFADHADRFVAVEPVSSDGESPITPVDDRKRVLNAFCHKHDCPKTRVADEAEVHIRDLYKWISADLADTSQKSKRIEKALRRGLLRKQPHPAGRLPESRNRK
jgi:hypothetical protein